MDKLTGTGSVKKPEPRKAVWSSWPALFWAIVIAVVAVISILLAMRYYAVPLAD